jgi:hypothetical protein
MLPRVNDQSTSSVRNCMVPATFFSTLSGRLQQNWVIGAVVPQRKVSAQRVAFGADAYNLFVKNGMEWSVP